MNFEPSSCCADLKAGVEAFLPEQGSVREGVAHAFCEVDQAPLLTLRAAGQMARDGNKAARDLIAAAMQVFGDGGSARDVGETSPTCFPLTLSLPTP